jgi:hypothetical protein
VFVRVGKMTKREREKGKERNMKEKWRGKEEECLVGVVPASFSSPLFFLVIFLFFCLREKREKNEWKKGERKNQNSGREMKNKWQRMTGLRCVGMFRLFSSTLFSILSLFERNKWM